jgi:ElaB/YqjD/DUF883 family membrane-anchored ribosome-binding protein
MKIETLHTRPAPPQQPEPDAETLPMPLAGADVGHAPVAADVIHRDGAAPRLGEAWDKARATLAELPARTREAKAQAAQYVAEQPVKATMIAFAGGAALAMLLRAAARRH